MPPRSSNMSQSAVSRQISALEEDLGVTLFIRHARGLVLTEVGEQLFRTATECRPSCSRSNRAADRQPGRPDRPADGHHHGRHRLAWLTPAHPRVPAMLYPDIQIEMNLNDAELDLAMREADVAIRLHRPSQPDMIQRKLFTVHNHFYASPDYLDDSAPRARRAISTSTASLVRRAPTSLAPAAIGCSRCGAKRDKARRPRLAVNNVHGVYPRLPARPGHRHPARLSGRQTDGLVHGSATRRGPPRHLFRLSGRAEIRSRACRCSASFGLQGAALAFLNFTKKILRFAAPHGRHANNSRMRSWLQFGMAVMRRVTLLERRRPRIVEAAVAPHVSSQSHRCTACSPLEYCRSPHRQTETGPLAGPGFYRAISSCHLPRRPGMTPTLAKARDGVGEIDDLCVGHRRQHLGHGGVVAVPRVVLVLAQRLDEIVLALVGDARNAFATGQIQIVAAVAAVSA